MVCCAFTAFMLSQIVLLLDRVRLRFGIAAPRAGASGLAPYAIVLTGGAVAAGLAIGAVWFQTAPQAFTMPDGAWCRTRLLP